MNASQVSPLTRAQPTVPFNRSYVGTRELEYIREAIESRGLSGDGSFTRRCQKLLAERLACRSVLLTHSATAALEMAALLSDVQPGDEVIMPSFTFVSTANAYVLRGAVPVFIDIRPDTLNMDEKLLEPAITARTRAIVPVHYAGVACEMDEIMRVAVRHGVLVVEDAAQGINAAYKGRALGSIGDMGAISFHATKNVSCGEGGAFITSHAQLADRAEIVREKGTNRSQFFRGEVDKYGWVATGSSYIPSELNAAYLLAQLEEAAAITRRRLHIWNRYHEAFAALERDGVLRRPVVPRECTHNGHIYYLLLADGARRDAFITRLKSRGIAATFHYVPLHSAPNGLRCSRQGSGLQATDNLWERLVRLPVWPGIEEHLDYIIEESVAAALALC